MKFESIRRTAAAAGLSLGAALCLSGCTVSNTVDYVYVATARNNPGTITGFRADRESGALTPIQSGFVQSGGRNPIAMATSPDGKNLYVVNHDDNVISQFAIGTDGKLYPQTTINSPGSNPDAIAINPAGTTLYVVDAFQAGYSPTNPGPGEVVAVPLKTDGTLPANNTSLPSYPVCNNPVAISVLGDGSAMYVVDDPGGQLPQISDANGSANTGASGSTTITYPAINGCAGGTTVNGQGGPFGQISSFTVGSDGTLTPASGSPFTAGVAPVSVVSDPSLRFVYVADSKANQLIAYLVQPNGVILPLNTSTYATDAFPAAVTMDPRGLFIYVSCFNAGTVDAFAIDFASGIPSRVAGGSYGVDTNPTAILVEPALGRYVYTANFIGGTASGLFITNPTTGTLTTVQNTPFTVGQQATAVAAVRHGDYKTQVVTQY